MPRLDETDLVLEHVEDGRSQYDGMDIENRMVVEARYASIPGYEISRDLCALPMQKDYDILRDELTTMPRKYTRMEMQAMDAYTRKRGLRTIQGVSMPLEHFYDLYEMIYSCLRDTYESRGSWLTDRPNADADDMESEVMSLPDLMSGRPSCWLMTGPSGSGKSFSMSQVLRTIPRAIRHKTEHYTYVQIPVLVTAVTEGNLSGPLLMLAIKIDEILGTGTFHADQMRKLNVSHGCLKLAEWIRIYHIGMIVIDEAQFLDFGRKSTSLENLIPVMEATHCSIGLIGNDEIVAKLEKYPRLMTRIGSNIISATCTTETNKKFLHKLLYLMWQFQWTKKEMILTESSAEVMMSEALYNVSFMKNLVMMVQFEAITRCPRSGITPEYIRNVKDRYFSNLQTVLYMNTPESDRQAMEILKKAELVVDESIEGERKKMKERALNGSWKAMTDDSNMHKMESVFSLLKETMDIPENEIEAAMRRQMKADRNFQNLPQKDIADKLQKILTTSMPDRKVKAEKKPASEEDIREVENAIGRAV